MGFPSDFFVLVRMSNDESNYTEINVLGVFPGALLTADIKNPMLLFESIQKERNSGLQINGRIKIDTLEIFKGIVEFDKSFSIHISANLVRLIYKALKLAEDTVQERLLIQEELAKSNRTFSIRTMSSPKTIVIDTL